MVLAPDDLFDSAESLGKRLGVSRSRLYATALAEFLAKHQGRKTTARLNRVYAEEEGHLEPSLRPAPGPVRGSRVVVVERPWPNSPDASRGPSSPISIPG